MSDNNGSFGPQDTEQKVLVSQWERALDYAEYESDTELRAKSPSETPDIVPRHEADPSDYLRPHEKPFVQGAIIFGGLFLAAGAIFWWFGGDTGKPVAKVPSVEPSVIPTQASDQALSEAEGKLALQEQNRKAEELAAEAKQAKINPSAKPSPSASAKVPPVVKQQKPQIVYRTAPQPKPSPVIVAKAPITAKPSPQTFIPIGNAQQVQRREKRVRPQRQPLASEKAFLDSLKSKPKIAPAAPVGDPLIAGGSAGARLMATLQFNSSSQSQNGQAQGQAMQVVLEQALKTRSGSEIPRGSILLFQAVTNSQSGAVTATSGDAMYNGRLIRIPKGAITIQSPNGDPLIAKSYRPGMDGLAAADRNNAVLGSVSAVGDELTKGSATTVIGNGSTVVSQNNTPNIWGAAAKGAFGGWSADQRQRTQAEATKILAAPPVQILPLNTPFRVTVTFPAPISFAR
jgi:hypothetical protein